MARVRFSVSFVDVFSFLPPPPLSLSRASFSLRSETLPAQTSGPLGIRAKHHRMLVRRSSAYVVGCRKLHREAIAACSPASFLLPARRDARIIPANAGNSRNLAREECTGVRRPLVPPCLAVPRRGSLFRGRLCGCPRIVPPPASAELYDLLMDAGL